MEWVSKCLWVVVVALIVDWVGLPGCCDVYWFFLGWRRLRKWRWTLCVECESIGIGLTLYNPQYCYQSTLCMLRYLGPDIDSQTLKKKKNLGSCEFWGFNWGVADDSIILRNDTAWLGSWSYCDEDTTLFRNVGKWIPSDAVSYGRRKLSSEKLTHFFLHLFQARSQNCEKRLLVRHVCLSVPPNCTNLLLLKGFSWKFIVIIFWKSLVKIQVLLIFDNNGYFT
jgi:hypothetical protein